MNTQKNTQQGFTLIELMIVIAIIGILAAIALPAYQDYTIRAKMAEPMAALAEAKTTISEYYATQSNTFPTLANSGLNTDLGKKIAASIKYTNSVGRIGVTIEEGIIPGAAALVGFSLSAVTRSDGSIIWICGTTSQASGVTSNVDAKYLPSSCRGI
ncbi:MAG: type IV pilus assembly protein PilA [Halioglobus sp.]|jgi:type IV pilus assembly protein PilA